MTTQTLLQKINELDDAAQHEVMDFIDFLLQKQAAGSSPKHPIAGFLKKHTIIMHDGFDAIPEGFEEYTD